LSVTSCGKLLLVVTGIGMPNARSADMNPA
jgi:hypothetical protein